MDFQEIWNWFVKNFIRDPWGALGFIVPIIAVVLGFIWRKAILGWMMFRWRETTHLGVLGVYYRELPPVKHDDGQLYYEILPGFTTPEILMSGMGRGTKFLVLKLDICNMDSIENRLISCKAQITHPKDIMTKIVFISRAYVNEKDLEGLYLLQQDFVNLIEDLSLPLTLKPGTTYTKHLCLELAYGSELIDGGKVEIIITDRMGKKSKLKFKFGIEKGKAFIKN